MAYIHIQQLTALIVVDHKCIRFNQKFPTNSWWYCLEIFGSSNYCSAIAIIIYGRVLYRGGEEPQDIPHLQFCHLVMYVECGKMNGKGIFKDLVEL